MLDSFVPALTRVAFFPAMTGVWTLFREIEGRRMKILSTIMSAGVLALAASTESAASMTSSADDSTFTRSESGSVRAPTQRPLPQSPDVGTIETIVVTAQKRNESLQSVPITIDTVTAEGAANANITSVADLGRIAPGLEVNTQTVSTVFYLRGVGSANTVPGIENAVAEFIDGVYIPTMAGVQFSFSDIDRIEVLKGPQGTLYGRNATGGAINIITLDPSQTPHVDGYVGYGNLQTVESNVYATGGLTEHVAANLAVHYDDQAQGAGVNLVTGAQALQKREYGIRGKVLWTPTDLTRITLSADYSYDWNSYASSYRPAVGTIRVYDGFTNFPGTLWDISSNLNTFSTTTQYGTSLKIEQDFGWDPLESTCRHASLSIL